VAIKSPQCLNPLYRISLYRQEAGRILKASVATLLQLSKSDKHHEVSANI